MVTITLLKNHPEHIPICAEIWHEVLGKIWVPEITVYQVIERFQSHLNHDTLPLTFIAICEDKVVGMCSLRENDGLPLNLSPWLGSLVVDPKYQNRGIGKMLIEAIRNKAIELGYEKLYLFAFDKTMPDYYSKLGWVVLSKDVFKSHPITVMSCLLGTENAKIIS